MTTEKDLYRKKNVYRETSQYPHFSLLKNATCIMIWDKNLRQNILQKAVFFLQCEQRKITQIFLKQFTITGHYCPVKAGKSVFEIVET